MKYLCISTKAASTCIVFALLTASCGEQSVQKSDDVSVVKIDSTKTSIVNVSGKLFSIPSPIQTAILIRNSNAPYQAEKLNSPSNAQNYSTNTAKAINLGVYGTEMAYASLFDDGQSALRYYKVVDDMANQLGIKGAIDEGLVARLGSNIGNADSLLILSGNFYQAADSYLKENDRLEVAAMVLLGGWVESTYLTALSANSGDEGARSRLAEQKDAIKTLSTVLETVAGKEFTRSEIMATIRELNALFGEISTTYKFVAPVTNPDTKTTKIGSKTSHEMSDQQMVSIMEKLNALRIQIIS